jgi:hypothetical protein
MSVSLTGQVRKRCQFMEGKCNFPFFFNLHAFLINDKYNIFLIITLNMLDFS